MRFDGGVPAIRPAGAAVLVLTAALAALAAADGPQPAEVGSPSDDGRIERLRRLHYTESHQVSMVLLPTSVTDRRGRNVIDLTKEDFRLLEDKVPQNIRYFSSEAREPISVAFVLDVSGSMRQLGKMDHAKEAIRFFVDQLRYDDRFALICFADEQVDWVTEFTADRQRFMRRLSVQEGYGKTALNDAIAAAPSLVDDGIKGRKAIVLITDGVDNSSRIGIEQAVDIARRVSVPVYSIGFLSVAENMLPKDVAAMNLEVLRFVSAETGGKLFAVHDPDELKEAVTAVDRELRHQYLLGYYPPRDKRPGGYREIQVSTERKRLTVRTRKGYYATP
ncbi:MAG TPA: VWA domain-containing protein [Candidatus Polarisedimenticolaceae bacterium]|nr:VWA domain-containing protein [Candidatus Polarisedimenticolaceae bacterium]